LGIAYKKDLNDYRDSPSLDIIQMLHDKGAEIKFNDPYIKSLPQYFNTGAEYVEIAGGDFEQFDCVVIATDHSCYDYKTIVSESRLIVDTRNATREFKKFQDKIITI
jgi:UDP-N-acetyl-D-glucosamine dehydrogenase